MLQILLKLATILTALAVFRIFRRSCPADEPTHRKVAMLISLLVALTAGSLFYQLYIGVTTTPPEPEEHVHVYPEPEPDVPRVELSLREREFAKIAVAPVRRRFVTRTIRLVGKVRYDERRLVYVTAWVPGRIDKLHVDFTGMLVTKGQNMVQLYSPQLYSAQQELIQAIKAAEELRRSELPEIRETAERTVESASNRLRLWGLGEEQIAQIERQEEPSVHIEIPAPASGTVFERIGTQGMYVEQGTRIYSIVDLSMVWVMLDAYEDDLQWIRYGQDIEFTVRTQPGELFTGKVAFIDPFLDDRRRIAPVRLNAENPKGLLKPDILVNGLVKATMDAEGKLVVPELAGKWICPVDPQIVQDEPGVCGKGGMPLVSAEELGYAGEDPVAPLVIPVSAPLITGKRVIVYVQVEPGTYEGREIKLGTRADDYYIVEEGLEEGELVVVRGNFAIDSSLQLQGRPSLMYPEGGVPPAVHHH